MKLTSNDKPWAPVDQPEYLVVLKPQQNPPKTAEVLLLEQVSLLRRLVAEASPEELDHAALKLQNGLTEAEQVALPLKMFRDRRTPNILLHQPAELNSLLGDWKAGLEAAVRSRPMPAKEAQQEAAELTLESFLGRIA